MPPATALKRLVWLYLVLLVAEGVLRKWILPGLSEPLLLARDPVVFAAYGVAIAQGRFPWTLSTLLLGGLAMLSLVFALVAGAPALVTLYGLRINYFHLPLVFVVAAALDRDDVLAIGRAVLWLTPPIVVLMLLQYQSGAASRWNVGAGGALGGQLEGALGKLRPSGPFSFTTGVSLWCALATAFIFHGWTGRGAYARPLLIAATLALVVAIPVSISRMTLFSVLVVVAFGMVGLLRAPGRAAALLAPAVVACAGFFLIGDGELTAAFEARWDSSVGSGIRSSIIDRFFGDFSSALGTIGHAPLFGHGVGMGSNVGARYVHGGMGFALAEFEWARIILELGPALGFAFIAYRCWLAVALVLAALARLVSAADNLAWLLCGACLIPIVSGQWGPPTNLGFAILGAGLALAALNEPESDEDSADEESEEPEDPDETEEPA